MPRISALYPLCRELEQHLPSLQGRLQRVLALWLKGTLLAHNGCRDSVAMALEAYGGFETLRRELREWTYDDADRIRAWGPDQEVEVEVCFPELLRWVRTLWTPCRDMSDAEAPLVLALDPTHHRDAWVAPVVSVACREHALPVAWQIVEARARGSRVVHFGRLLRRLAPAVPSGTPVHVLCDQGLGSRTLWQRIVELGWHPVLRYPPHITFRPTDGPRVPARDLGDGPGTLWLGMGTAFGRAPLPGTLVVLHVQGHKDPWLLPADTLPAQTDAALYACRHRSGRASGAASEAAGNGCARAGGTPCAWPGTCWSWPWPRCWRSPAAPGTRTPATAVCVRAGCAVRRPRPDHPRPPRDARPAAAGGRLPPPPAGPQPPLGPRLAGPDARTRPGGRRCRTTVHTASGSLHP